VPGVFLSSAATLFSGFLDSALNASALISGFTFFSTGLTGASVELDSTAVGSTGCDSTGLASTGFDSTGLASTGFDSTGLASIGFDSTGLASIGFDSTGLASIGFDSADLDLAGFDSAGLDSVGFDSVALDATGMDSTEPDSSLPTEVESESPSCDSPLTALRLRFGDDGLDLLALSCDSCGFLSLVSLEAAVDCSGLSARLSLGRRLPDLFWRLPERLPRDFWGLGCLDSPLSAFLPEL